MTVIIVYMTLYCMTVRHFQHDVSSLASLFAVVHKLQTCLCMSANKRCYELLSNVSQKE